MQAEAPHAPARSARAARLAILLSAASLGVMGACRGLFGPDERAAPVLRVLAIHDLTTRLGDGGILDIDALPADTGFRLGTDQSLEVDVGVSSGDREHVALSRLLCPPRERGPHFECFDFFIVMQAGIDVRSVGARVAAAGGRFGVVATSGSFASVTLFRSDRLLEVARAARTWPGVAYTEPYARGCTPEALDCSSLSQMRAPVPVDTGVARIGDGIVQVRSADTVVVSYLQPAGARLEAWRVVP